MVLPLPPTTPLPPLRFERIALEKVWGGRRLETLLGLRLPAGRPIGETWELTDRDERHSIVAEGPLRGARLGDLARERAADLLGQARPVPGGRFPLLVKFLDATHSLSIQVHPSADSARVGEEAKTEAWLILAAEPGSRIWLGFAPGVTRADVESAAGTSALLRCMRDWPARAGEAVLVRGGTVHSIGAGVTLLEVQQNADTTHRLFDWDRAGLDGRARPIHVAPALRSIAWDAPVEGPRAPVWRAVEGGRRAPLVDCPLFALESADVESEIELETGGVARVLAVIRGAGSLAHAAGSAVDLSPGDVWLIPAALGRFRLVARAGALSVALVATKA